MTNANNIDTTDATRLNDPMNPRVKALWLEALRSGEFKKGMGRLRKVLSHVLNMGRKPNAEGKDDRYCCFGVLCELYRRDTGKGYWATNDSPYNSSYDYDFYDERGHSSSGMPTTAVYEWAGMQHQDTISLDAADAKKFKDSDGDPVHTFYPATQNDSGRTFKTIAQVIEKYL